MVYTRSMVKSNVVTIANNNTDNDFVNDDNVSVGSDSESESEYEYHSETEELSDYSVDSDDSFNIEKEELYIKKKHEAINILKDDLRKLDILKKKGHISLQCNNNDENPEFMDIIYSLYNTIMNYEIYISYKAEEQFDKLYDTCIDRLYHITINLVKTHKRPDLSFNIYNKYKEYYNLSYDKIFLNLDCDKINDE